jgi:hypothetical protein
MHSGFVVLGPFFSLRGATVLSVTPPAILPTLCRSVMVDGSTEQEKQFATCARFVDDDGHLQSVFVDLVELRSGVTLSFEGLCCSTKHVWSHRESHS